MEKWVSLFIEMDVSYNCCIKAGYICIAFQNTTSCEIDALGAETMICFKLEPLLIVEVWYQLLIDSVFYLPVGSTCSHQVLL